MGIDYGMGQTNIDKATGMRYGVIPMNDLSSFAWDDILVNGDDLDFAAYKQECKTSIATAIGNALEELGLDRGNDAEELADGIVDDLEWDGYENTGDCARYAYDDGEVSIETASDGDVWVLKSLYYTYAPFCSPCAPGAGYLRDAGTDDSNPKVYCLPKDWFDDEQGCPYPYWTVDGDELVFQPAA